MAADRRLRSLWLADTLRQEVHEQSHLGRQVAVMGVQRPHARARGIKDHDTVNCCSKYVRIYSVIAGGEYDGSNQSPQIMSQDAGMDIWFEPGKDLLWTDGECTMGLPSDNGWGEYVRRSYRLCNSPDGVVVDCISTAPASAKIGKYDRQNRAQLISYSRNS